MPNTGRVTVAKGLSNRFDQYDLNDGIETIGDAVQKFVGESNELPPVANVRVNGQPAGSYEGTVRDGDNILVQDAAVAEGGLKGA